MAALRGKSPEETVIDLVIEDGSEVATVYFLMSEDNVRKQLALPYMSFCSDMASVAAEGVHHVFVNGVQVLRDGEPTDARPGRALRGPGWKGARK